MENVERLAFGPVPSRRLGKSLGVNNILPKHCTYSCVYCQVGKNTEHAINRKFFHSPENILIAVKNKLNKAKMKNETVNYITLVSDGEPTLDINLGKIVSSLKQTNLPVAVLTNASLLWMPEVQEDLLSADYVSLKVDAISEYLWKKVDRPCKGLKIDNILQGIRDFTEIFKGIIVTETMLVNDVDYSSEFKKIALFLSELKKLNKAYIAIPIRPPIVNWVKPANEDVINEAFQIFSKTLCNIPVEYMTGYEGDAFAFSGDVEKDLLSITAVHPMREDAVRAFLEKANISWKIITELIASKKIVELYYEGNKYYMNKNRNEANL